MARISGVDLPKNKNIDIALTYIYGIGRTTSRKSLHQLNIDPHRKSDQLDEQEVARIREIVDGTCKVEGDLRREVSMNIKRLRDLSAYRGLRHRKSLPVRGQRTHTNARTRKGPRRKLVGRKSKAS